MVTVDSYLCLVMHICAKHLAPGVNKIVSRLEVSQGKNIILLFSVTKEHVKYTMPCFYISSFVDKPYMQTAHMASMASIGRSDMYLIQATPIYWYFDCCLDCYMVSWKLLHVQPSCMPKSSTRLVLTAIWLQYWSFKKIFITVLKYYKHGDGLK